MQLSSGIIGAVSNHWTGLVDWTGGLDWWTDTKNNFYTNETHSTMSYVEPCKPSLLLYSGPGANNLLGL